MQIAMIGNINNAAFFLGEGLREIGVNVRLLVTRPDRLHHPVKAGLVDELPFWVYDASSLGLGAFERQEASIAPALGWVMDKADLAILNDTGPSLHNLLPLPVMSFLTGSDLSYYATLSSGPARRAGWSPGFISTVHGLMDVSAWEEVVVRQRGGIRRSCLVHHPWRGMLPDNDALLDEIGVEDDRRICLMNMDIKRITAAPLPPGETLAIFNGARLNWAEPMPQGFSSQDHKGTDRLLEGFAQFLQRGGKGQLTLVEKGLHVSQTRDLARALGLEAHIVWKPELSLQAFYAEIERAHVVCDNLGRSTLGQTSLSAMAAGRPVLASFGPARPPMQYASDWPIFEAQTAEDVAGHLWALYRQPERRDQFGRKGRRFVETHLSPVGAARTLMERLSATLRIASLEGELKRIHEGRID